MSHHSAAALRRTRPGRHRTGVLSGVLLAFLGLIFAPPASADAPASDRRAAAFEVAFMREMIDHHQMGVHMAEVCLDKDVRPALRRLCRSIARVQAEEIELMLEWLEDWYGIRHEPSMDDPHHHHQMMQLEALEGPEFEEAFLEMMIEHHVPAVVEGRECATEAEHRQLKRLCRSIFTSQIREIVQMQVWLCRWFGECEFRNPLTGRR